MSVESAELTYQGASSSAIQSHYDISNEFYALWLDEGRSYSCALWADGDTRLEDAQDRKLDYLTEGANAPGKARVLDVGCGWGALLNRLTTVHGVQHGVGLTLAEEQAAHVRALGNPKLDVRVENWIDHQPEQGYDAIISIGAFEHFADFGLRRDGRVAAYREFFARCHEWLPHGGRLALQTNVKGNNTRMNRQTVRDLLFIVDKIFPESELPWGSEILEAGERLFDTVSVRNDAEHYARTCQCWHDNLVANRDEAVRIVGEDVVVDYQRYLAASSRAFTDRHLGLMRLVFEKV